MPLENKSPRKILYLPVSKADQALQKDREVNYLSMIEREIRDATRVISYNGVHLAQVSSLAELRTAAETFIRIQNPYPGAGVTATYLKNISALTGDMETACFIQQIPSRPPDMSDYWKHFLIPALQDGTLPFGILTLLSSPCQLSLQTL